ncbi:MAG: hypothetical protein K5917_01175 [Clostridiales bacterium]|nr:hypothetical protein [Clostridiales bacterium]
MKKDYFIPKMFYRMLVPALISSMGFAFSDVADAFVVGRRMGEPGLAAISLCLPIYMLMNILMDGFGIGGGIRFSQQLGANNEKEANLCFNRIWKAALVSGVLFAVLGNVFAPQILMVLGAEPKGSTIYQACEAYMRIISLGAPVMILNIVFLNFLRNDNNEVLAARGFLIGNITDLVLNIVLVLVFDLGTIGAGLSTVIGSIVAVCCYMPGIVGKKSNVINIARTDIDIKQVSSCFRTGFSISVKNLFQFIFLLVVNRVMLSIGGEAFVAVFDIVYSASFFIIYLCDGTSDAAQPIVSAFAGEQSEEDCRRVRTIANKYAILLGGIVAAFIFIFAKYVALFFGISEAGFDETVRGIRIYCLGFAFIALNTIMSRYCQAKEENNGAFFDVLLRNFLIAIPSVLLFYFLGGSKYIWYAFPVSEFLSFVIFLIYYCITEKKRVRFDESRVIHISMSGADTEISSLLDKCDKFCDKWGAKENQKYYVMLVIEEIVASIIRNALVNIPDGKIRITLIAMENGDFSLHLLDNAVKFNPLSSQVKNKNGELDFDIDEISLLLIKKKVKKYLYRQCTGFNSLIVQI